MHSVFIEAIDFIEKKLITPSEWAKGIRPPADILSCEDPRYLVMWASSKSPSERLRRAWACAILRIMHTIAHIEGIAKITSLNEARAQITARFSNYLVYDDQHQLWFGTPNSRIRLAQLEWKHFKTRHSIILKLLHKKDNVAETIYDYIGVRLVTTRLCDVMMAVKILHQTNIISYPNCYPSRARNSLIDYPRFRSQIENLREMLISGAISPEDFEVMLSRLSSAEQVTSNNPHSSSSYRSIQMTARQLIHTGNYRFEWLTRLKEGLHGKKLPSKVQRILQDLEYLVEKWHSVKDATASDQSRFFPYEVQIMDENAYTLATSGAANHDIYKSNQISAARSRVLGKVLELYANNERLSQPR